MRARDVKPFLQKTLDAAIEEHAAAVRERDKHVATFQRAVDIAQAKVEATKALIADMAAAGATEAE